MPTPPAADIEALTAPKPLPKGDIVNNDTAAALHSEAIEAWGDGLSAAGKRVCRWFVEAGAKVDCVDAPVEMPRKGG
jgi:hypothetical protein